MIEEWISFGILRLLRSIEMGPVLALVAVARVPEVFWAALPDQEWLSHDHSRRMIVLRPGEVRRLKRVQKKVKGEEAVNPWYGRCAALVMQLLGCHLYLRVRCVVNIMQTMLIILCHSP